MTDINERAKAIREKALSLGQGQKRIDVNDLLHLVTEAESVTGQRRVIHKALRPLVDQGILHARMERVGTVPRNGCGAAIAARYTKGKSKFYYLREGSGC